MSNNIVFVERIFPHYRKAVYDRIYEQYQFRFYHTVDKNSGIRQVRETYSSIIKAWYYGKKESSVYLFLLKELLRAKPALVIHEFSAGYLSIPFLLMFCRLTGKKLVFWGHMYNRSNGYSPSTSLSDRYRRWLWHKADGLVTYSAAEKELLNEHGVDSNKVFVAFNTIDTNAMLKVRENLQKIGKSALKARLGFRHTYNLVFIGRLYREKKPEILLELLVGLNQSGIDSVAIHYVGDGEMMAELRDKVTQYGLENDTYFHGSVYDEVKTGELLFCSDLMVMPGCVGLSVNHAFCFNCPVVTFSSIGLDPAHGPEIEYIIDRKTGFLVNDHTVDALMNVVADYLTSSELQATMQQEVSEMIRTTCSVENMANGVIEAIEYIIENK